MKDGQVAWGTPAAELPDCANGHIGTFPGRAEDRNRERPELPPIGKLLSEVEPEQVEWLWPGRLPLGKLAVLDGDPGLGKSAVTLDLAARVSAGLELPDGERYGPAGVVLLSAEDGLRDTIKPRLDAAGADADRIFGLSSITDDALGRPVSLPKDLDTIERAIGHVDASLVVVDPIMAFLSGGTDSYKDQDVRRVLTPLAALAERTRAAVLIVRHLSKTVGGNALYRSGGSIGIIGAARSGLVVAEDPEDPGRRVLASSKHNLSKRAPSLVFRVEAAPNGAARVIWGGTSSLSAGDILRETPDPEQRSALSEAKVFLMEELADGPLAAELVKKDARAAGVSERTLKRAKRALGAGSAKESDGSWSWVPLEEKPKGGQTPIAGTVGPVGSLGKDANAEHGIPAHLKEGGQEGRRDHEQECIHGYRDGKGCYIHDPDHPYRLKEGGAV